MVAPPRDPKEKRRIRSAVLRRVRLLRGKRPPEVAGAMGMIVRSYGNFEAGKGRLHLEKVHQFANVLGADAYGVLASIDIGSTDFAARTADNKFMTAFLLRLREFDARAQDKIALLPTYQLMDVFNEMFEKLEKAALTYDAAIKKLDEDPSADEDGQD